VDLVHEGEELVAGRHPVEEALAARRQARRLLVVPHRREALERIVLHATTLRIPIIEVEGGTLTAIAGFDGHQGVAIVVAARRFDTLEDVLARAIERGEPPFVLALDSLEDPQNLGSLLRSAEAAGVHGVLFPTRRQAPLTPAAIKASAGAVEHLLLVPVDDLAGALADLHVRGLRVAGAEADAALTHREADLRGPIVLVVGHEGQGLGPAVRRRCDLLVRIPMHGRIASLNAAVAGSILLFEAAGQRGEAPPPPVIADHRDEIEEADALAVDGPTDVAEIVVEAVAAPAPSRRKRAGADPAVGPASPGPKRTRTMRGRAATADTSRASAERSAVAAPGAPTRGRRKAAADVTSGPAVGPAATPAKARRTAAPAAAAAGPLVEPAAVPEKKSRKKAAAAAGPLVESAAVPEKKSRKKATAAAGPLVEPAAVPEKKSRKKAAASPTPVPGAEPGAPRKGRKKATAAAQAAAAEPDPDDDLLPGGPSIGKPVRRPAGHAKRR
jgi:23S rRNA (guanosine2251-2'-O)-methyltransferase